MSPRANTIETFCAQLQVSRYWEGRWDYHAVAIAMAMGLAAKHVLEIGANEWGCFNGWGCFQDSVLMGIDMTGLAYLDASKPWAKLADDSFDVVIALQVIEHMPGAQEVFIAEALRVAPALILSVPHEWTPEAGDALHAGINRALVAQWAQRLVEPPVVVGGPSHRRAIYLLRR